jgi:hypothetical protein
MIDYTNVDPILQRQPDRSPLQLEVGDQQFNPLPEGGFASNAMFGTIRRIDPTQKFNPNAWAVRKREDDTWGQISDIELTLSGTQGNYDSMLNWLSQKAFKQDVFNDPAKGAMIKALYMNRSPMDYIKYGDSQLTDESVKEAQVTLGLLMDKEKNNPSPDPTALSDNHKQIKQLMDYLIYAEARKSNENSGNYSLSDYFAASTKDTPGLFNLFGGNGGPWNWYAQTVGWGMRDDNKEMPKDTKDIEAMLGRVDPYFSKEEYWKRATENPIVQEGLLDSGVSFDTIRSARNEDEAEFFINRALVKSNIEKRLAVYTANSNWAKNFAIGTVNLGTGLVMTPDMVPFTLATVGYGAVAKGIAGGSALLARGVVGATTATRLGMTAEAALTLPVGVHPAFLSNMGVLANLSASAVGMGSIATLHDAYVQDREMAYAAALQYADPEAQKEFDTSRLYSAFGHGALTGAAMYLGGMGFSSLLGAVNNRISGVMRETTLPNGQKIRFRNDFDRRLTFEGTTLGNMLESFGTVKSKVSTLLDRSPAEKVIIESINDGTEPTANAVHTETHNQVNRSSARSTTTADGAEAKPSNPLHARVDNETRAAYAKRMGASGELVDEVMFLNELGRRTAADVESNDAIGSAAGQLKDVDPAGRARILIGAEERIKEARAAEVEGAGGTLAPEREAFYANLEKRRKSWLKNSLNKLTKLERQEFYKSLRGQPVADRINAARNTAASAAERNASADSVAAQVIEAARTGEKVPELKDAAVEELLKTAELENKVLGNVSNETAEAIKQTVKTGKTSKPAKITKMISKSIKNMDPVKVGSMRLIAKDHNNFLLFAKGNKENIMAYFDTVNKLFAENALTEEYRTILLVSALDFDFNSKAFDIKYAFAEEPPPLQDALAMGSYDNESKTITFYLKNLRNPANELEHAGVVLLHELGHRLVASTFTGKEHFKMLRSYNEYMAMEGSLSLGFMTREDRLGQIYMDPIRALTDAYILSNAEEMYVESFAQLMFAANKEALVSQLTPMQQSRLKIMISNLTQHLINVVTGLDESAYYKSVQLLIEYMQEADSYLTNTVTNVTEDMRQIIKNLDPESDLSRAKPIKGAASNTIFSAKDIEYMANADTSPAQLAAFAMLKSNGKELFTQYGAYSKNLKTFMQYYYAQREASIYAKAIDIMGQTNETVRNGITRGFSEERIQQSLRDTLSSNRSSSFGSYEQTGFLIALDDIRNGLNNDSITDALEGFMFEQMTVENLSGDAISVADMADMLNQMEKDGVSNLSVNDRLRSLMLDEGLTHLAAVLDSEVLENYRADVLAGNEQLLRYSKKSSEVPHTIEGLTEVFETLGKKFDPDKLINILDSLTLAFVGKAETPAKAVAQLELLAKSGALEYNKELHKWGLKQNKPAAPKVAKPAEPAKLAEVSRPEATDGVELTSINIERHLTALADPQSAEGKTVRAMLYKVGSIHNIEDAIMDAYVKFASSLDKLKAKIGEDTFKSSTDLRKLFVSSAKNRVKDLAKKGKFNTGLSSLLKKRDKIAADLKIAVEGKSKDAAELSELLNAIEFEISTFKTLKTGDIYVEGPTGESSEVSGIRAGKNFAEVAAMTEKERQDFLGGWLLKADTMLRKMMGLSEDVNGILSKDARKLWEFLESDKEGTDLQGVTFSDAKLSEMSEKIFGKKVSESGIQRIRSSPLKEFQDLRVSLELTSEDMLQSMDNGVINLDSKVMKAIADRFKNTTKLEVMPKAGVDKPAAEVANATQTVATKLADKAALESTKPAEPITVPHADVEPTSEVAYTVKDADGNTAGPELMTSEAADKIVQAREGEVTTKEAVEVPKADIVATTTKGEVVTKKGTKTKKVGSVKVEDPKGKMAFEKNGIKITKEKAEPKKETDPVVPNAKPAEPKPVKDSPVVKEEEHIRFERLTNEQKDMLRANGSDVNFLSMFQKAYWKVMKAIDKGGKRTSATPLFKELFAHYIAINNAIKEANVAKFGEQSIATFWKYVDELRAEQTLNAQREPGFKRMSEAQLLKKAAKKVHNEFMPPTLLGHDVKIMQKDGKYILVPANKKTPKVIERSPFPAPAEKPKPAASEVKPAEGEAAKPAAEGVKPAEAVPEEAPPVSRNEAVRAAIYSAANKQSMPLRMSNFIGWIFGGSNRAERNWWQRSTSNLANILQSPSRLGDTVRSDRVGIRVLASLLDGTRNVTGLLVAPDSAPILTLLGCRGVQDRVLIRLMNAQLEVMKQFGGDVKSIDAFQKYLWTKTAKGEAVTQASLVADLKLSSEQAKNMLPSILKLVDVHQRTNELFLRLGDETGMAIVYDSKGNPFDPKTFMNVQFDHEKLARMTPETEAILMNALVDSRRKRKMGELLDVNTMIALGWIDATAEGGGAAGGLMLRDRKFGHGPGARALSMDTLSLLEQPNSTVGGNNTNTIASLARHGDPKNLFVLEHNGQIKAYRVPRTRADLSAADLLIYDQAVGGDTSMYTPRWQKALNGMELTRAEMSELLDYKLKRGRYREGAQDRPLLKTESREEVQLAIPGLTPEEILSDGSGVVLDSVRTNLFEAQHFLLRGRLTEMLFQKELNRFFGRTDITMKDLLSEIRAMEDIDIRNQANSEKWSDGQKKAALASLTRGFKRIEEEYRYNVDTMPHIERNMAGDIASGALTIARIFTAPGYWLSAGPEVMGALVHHNPVEWPKAVVQALKYTLGKERFSKTALLNSEIGDLSFTLEQMRTEMSNRYLGEEGKGGAEIDSVTDTALNGPRSQWNNKPMQGIEMLATGAEALGSLTQISNLPRHLSKIEMQREIYRNLKAGRIQKLVEAMNNPEIKKALQEYLEASSKSAYEERKQWKKFAGIARENGFGKDPNNALFYLRYGLNTMERLKHLQWAIEKVGDSEGRVNLIRMMELTEDVRRNPVSGIDPNVLEDATRAYSHGIDAEIIKRRTPEPYGLNKITDMEGRSAFGRVVYALSGWMRAFHDGRIMDYSNKSMPAFLKFAAFYTATDMTYSILKEWLAGRDVEDMLEEMEQNPASILSRAMHSLPLFGIASGLAEDAVNVFSGGSLFKPTVDLSTPGLTTVGSLLSRTNRELGRAKDSAMAGEIPETLGHISNVIPISPIVNKSIFAVPVRTLQTALDADEKNNVNRYLDVVQREHQPYKRMARTMTVDPSMGYVQAAPQRNLLKEQEALKKLGETNASNMAKAQPMSVVPPRSTNGIPSSISTPLAELLKPRNQ